MKLMQILTLPFAALALQACVASTPSAKAPINLPSVDTRLTECKQPVLLPERPLTQAETEKFWAADRDELRLCGERVKSSAEFYSTLRNSLNSN